MGKENLTLGNIDFEKNKFYRHKTPIFQGDVDIENVLIFNKIILVKKTISTVYWLLI